MGYVSVIAIAVSLFLFFITYVFFPKNDKAIHFDAYLVLGAAPTKEGTLSRMMKSRVEEAVSQYQFCRRPIVFTGGIPYSTQSEASIMAVYAAEKGIPKEHILLEEKARNTFENFKYSIPILTKHDFTRICIITNTFHLRRAMFFARKFSLTHMAIGASLKPYFHLPYRLFLIIFESTVRVKCLFYEITTKT